MAFYNRIPSIESQLVKIYSSHICLCVNKVSLGHISSFEKFLADSETTPSVQALTLNGSNPDLLPQFVKEAHSNVSFKLDLTNLRNLTNNLTNCVAYRESMPSHRSEDGVVRGISHPMWGRQKTEQRSSKL